jgi:hypothetical protein
MVVVQDHQLAAAVALGVTLLHHRVQGDLPQFTI